MRLSILYVTLSCILISACTHKDSNPVDPYEPFNRKMYTFNKTMDTIILKPPATAYVSLVPTPIRTGINNFFNNLYMIPTVANDILQAKSNHAIQDTWRFVINATIGVGGLFDPASHFGLPLRYNDLGITFATWGDKKSPYLVLPFLGPSTIRDAMGVGIEYVAFTPYSWFIGTSDALLYVLGGVRTVDLRANFFETEKLMSQALDEYTFVRDAWLARRQYLITGVEVVAPVSTEDGKESFGDYVDE